jgi:TPR repeat protein
LFRAGVAVHAAAHQSFKTIMKRIAVALLLLTLAAPAWGQDYDKGIEAYSRGDYEAALREFLPLAEQGDAVAQHGLAGMYKKGEGVSQDYIEALKWYRRAADQGVAGSQLNIGRMYNIGLGVPQDFGEAVKWYRLAAKQGNANGQYALGFMYGGGRGTPQDYGEAVKWYRKAAEQGNAIAQFDLGLRYGAGQGIPQDYLLAHKWLNLAASRLPAGELRHEVIKYREIVATGMTAAQIAKAQRLAREWKPK